MVGPRVVVTIRGGNVQDVECPAGVEVEIRDYDNGEDFDSVEDARRKWPSCDYGEDERGAIYSAAVYGGDS